MSITDVMELAKAYNSDLAERDAKIERLKKALEQALRYEEWVYSDEKRCPELAAYLKEKEQ